MIRLPVAEIPTETRRELGEFQATVNKAVDHAQRVLVARQLFASKNRRDNKTFATVRTVLSTMCSGAQRCCYCEDSAADEVEHIKPKHLYPEQVFVWENYLYACGPCNGPKNNKFAVFDPASGLLSEITRAQALAGTGPPKGDPVIIDPRKEDPLSFFELDLRDTFQFVPAYGLPYRQKQRALYTSRILRLNERDLLVEARRTAYGSYVARLKEYTTEKAKSPTSKKLALYIEGLRRMDHPTVWKEIQRQNARFPSLALLFNEAPEALGW